MENFAQIVIEEFKDGQMYRHVFTVKNFSIREDRPINFIKDHDGNFIETHVGDHTVTINGLVEPAHRKY